MKRTFIILFAIMFLVSCGPSINPLLQQRINEIYSKQLSKTYKSGSFTKVLPYEIGQWVMHSYLSDGKRSIQKTSIVGKEQGGWIIETYSLNEYSEGVTQMLVRGLEKAAQGDVEAVEIVWIKTKDEKGNVQTIDGIVLSISKGMYKQALHAFNINIEAAQEGGVINVPAGTFNGTSKINSKMTVLGKTYNSQGWYHSEVPINGVIKSVSNEGEYTMELLDFGLSGAKSSI